MVDLYHQLLLVGSNYHVLFLRLSTAQAVYNKLKGEVRDTKLLHARSTRKDRNEKENELERSKLKPEDPNYKPLPKIAVFKVSIVL